MNIAKRKAFHFSVLRKLPHLKTQLLFSNSVMKSHCLNGVAAHQLQWQLQKVSFPAILFCAVLNYRPALPRVYG